MSFINSKYDFSKILIRGLNSLVLFLLFTLLVLPAFSLKATEGEMDPPQLVGTIPFNEWVYQLLDDPISLAFNEIVRPASQGGQISIYEVETGELFFSTPASGSSVEIFNNLVTITPPQFKPSTHYYVTVDADALEDTEGNLFAGFSDQQTFNFTTDDGISPTVIEFEPENGTVTNSTCSCVKMVWNEPVKQLDGFIQLHTGDGTVVETIRTNVVDSRLEFFLNELTINFSTDFEDEQSYYITMSAGSFGHIFSEDPSVAIKPGDWTFSTSFKPKLVSLSPAVGSTGDISQLEMEFDVEMQLGSTARMRIYDYERDSVLEEFFTSQLIYSENKIIIRPKVKYPLGLRVYVVAERDNVFERKDNGSPYKGLTEKGDWEFTVGATNYNSFETTWSVEEDNGTITLPMEGDGYYYTVDWGDGTREVAITEHASHSYATAGDYKVSISGYFPRFLFKNAGDKDKILDIGQWGDMHWDSMDSAFYGCTKLNITAEDAPNLSQVKSTNSMFRDATVFNSDIGHWDLSQNRDAAYMFEGAVAFNQNINDWRLASVTDMQCMFKGAVSFNQPVNDWSVFNVENMKEMFKGATSFNQPVSNWQVWEVENMAQMFMGATSFNQTVSNWRVTRVLDMTEMFKDAAVFNRSFGSWKPNRVTSMKSFLENAVNFNQTVGGIRIDHTINLENFLDNTAITLKNYDISLKQWLNQSELANDLTLGVQGLKYCHAEYDREDLIQEHGWTFVGDEQDCVGQEFIMTWETAVAKDTVLIPTTGGGYNYTVDWGDGTVEHRVSGDIYHIYDEPGEKTVKIKGDFPRIYFQHTTGLALFDFQPMRERFRSVDQWGSIRWSSMAAAFFWCTKMTIKATDVPDLSNVTSTRSMFRLAVELEGDFSKWDVSNITDFETMFQSASIFNSDIGDWDMSNAETIEGMFHNAAEFNQDISRWDVSNVKNMKTVFAGAKKYNQPLNDWDVSNVENMFLMFSHDSAFNQPLDKWDVSNVKNMEGMFRNALSFNQNINNWKFNEELTSLRAMFQAAISFNQPLDQWDVSGITDIREMFRADTVFNQNLNGWDVSNVKEMSNAFSVAYAFNSPLDQWDTGNVENMGGMFFGAFSFNQPIGNWDVSKVTNMQSMFFADTVFNQPIGDWDVSNVTNMTAMFAGAWKFNQPIGDWDVGNVTGMSSMFEEAKDFNQPIGKWDVSKVENFHELFSEASSFNQDISEWDVGNVWRFWAAFRDASSFDQDLSKWDLSNASSFTEMFDRSGMSRENYDRFIIAILDNIEDIAPTGISAEGVPYCEAAEARDVLINTYGWTFNGDVKECTATEAFITQWVTTTANEQITIPTTGGGYNYQVDWGDGTVETGFTGDASHAYAQAGVYTVKITGAFPRIYFNKAGDKDKIISIEQWGDIEWSSMEHAFSGCENLVYNAVGSPDLSAVTSLSNAFEGVKGFNDRITSWNVQPITQMDSLFFNVTGFDQSLQRWNVSSVTDMKGMLSSTGMSRENYDKTLKGWAGLAGVMPNITVGAEGLLFCEGEEARNLLISENGWVFEGDIRKCPDLLAPEITSATNVEVTELIEEAAYLITATDEDSEPELLSFSLGTEKDEVHFRVEGNEVWFKEIPDYEEPLDANKNNIYELELIASDGTNSSQKLITIKVTDINETPPWFTTSKEVYYDENGTDPAYYANGFTNAWTKPTFSMLGGYDSDLFRFHDDNRVSFKSPPDYENPLDADGNNDYQVELMAFDGYVSSTQVVTIHVNDKDEDPPVINSAGEANVNENSEALFYTIEAEDDQQNNLKYRLGEGPDDALFTIQGEFVGFKEGPDYENPLDDDKDNVYELTVIVSDFFNEVEKLVLITVNDVDDEAPVITSPSELSIEENTSGAVYTITATDVDTDASRLSYRMKSELDAVRFEFSGTNLFFASNPDFEEPRDGDRNNIYEVVLTVTDGIQSTDIRVRIEVIDIDDPIVSVDDPFFSEMGVSTYPIPAGNTLYLKRETTQSRALRFEMVNAQGTVLTSGELSQRLTEVDLSRVDQGMYFLKLTDGVRTGYKKILVRK